MKKKKLVIVTTVPQTLTGILFDQPKYLNEFFDVEIVTSPGEQVARVSSREGVPIHLIGMARRISPFCDLRAIWDMFWLLMKTRPDIIHSYTPKAGLVAMIGAWLARVPVRIHTFTGLVFPTQHGLKRMILVWVDRLICFCATNVVPEGDGVKEDLVLARITTKPLQKIGHGNIAGVDTDYYTPGVDGVAHTGREIREKIGVGPEEFLFLFVGRLNKDKGVRELVSAFQSLGAKAHLVLVGAVDKVDPVDRATMSAIEANPHIHYLGFQTDIRPVMACADALVLPSYREGFPNVVLQAGAMQLPALVTDVSGSNEAIEDGLNGWVVAPRDADALRMAMEGAIGLGKARLREMGLIARERVKERFERVEHWRRVKRFYMERLGVNGGAGGAEESRV